MSRQAETLGATILNGALDGILAVLFILFAVFGAALLRAPRLLRARTLEAPSLTIFIKAGTRDRLRDAANEILKEIVCYAEMREKMLGHGPVNTLNILNRSTSPSLS